MNSNSRIIAAYLVVFLCFIILVLRYSYLQLIDHGTLLKQSVDNYSSIVATPPVRGGIIDKHDIILADNKASYAIAIMPKDAKNIEVLFKQLDKFADITSFDQKKFFTQLKKAKKYDWVIIKDDLSDQEIASLTAHNYLYPQVMIFARSKRYYPFSNLYAHSIGYVGRVSATDKTKLEREDNNNYVANDYIGKNGLEKYYEDYLRGTLGKKIIRTDATGNETGLIANNPAIDGYTIRLTIDHHLEDVAWKLLGDRDGAIVAIDPQTGGILVYVSKPGFDPNWFIDGISTDDWQDLSHDPDKPLLNRAVQGSYPPGSTFKPFLALSALFLGFRSKDYVVYDPGYFVIPGSSHRFRDSQPHGLGSIAMFDAIRLSSDAYFYKLAYDMGIDRIDKGIALFGLGSKTGVDLPEENTGLLPTREWKAKRFAKDSYQKNWLAADSVTIGIGQGFNHYTPIQMARAVSIIANEGISIKPHFLNQVIDKSGLIIKTYAIESHQLPIDKSQFKFMKKAMQAVVERGTAAGINHGLTYTMAGKTGTAQVVAMAKNSRSSKFSGRKFKDHSWFIAFAPVDKPTIVVAVVVEHGGWGAVAAAPIARALFDAYFNEPSESATESTPYRKYVPSAPVKQDELNNDENQSEDSDYDSDEMD